MRKIIYTAMSSEDYDFSLLPVVITFKRQYNKRFSGRYNYPRYKRLILK